ncbi:MAG: metallophosphoesterase [Candidatus Bathyarchaeia archaeon]
MSLYNPDIVLHSGDFVEDRLEGNIWMNFLNHTDKYWVTKNRLTIPVIPAIGNHDSGGDNYRSLFSLPGKEL